MRTLAPENMRTAQDSLRQHRARQHVLSERDTLLTGANKKVGVDKLVPTDGKETARAILVTLFLVSVGLLPYMITVLVWFFRYHQSFPGTLVAIVVLLAVAVCMMLGSRKKVLGRERTWLWYLGAIWLQATIFGTILGFFLYFRHLAYYWKYEEMRTYTNVGASQDPDAFGDGSMFLFTEDTRLDALRSVGYRSRWTGSSYCVAPVVDGTMSNSQDIFYWAIGEDCCNPRAEFHCDDSEDFQTRSALVVLEPEDVVRPWMRWAARGSAYPQYEDAIRLQEATYFTKAALRPKLIRWTRDPIALKDSFYWSAANACRWVSGFYLVLVYTTAFFAVRAMMPAQRKEAVMR